MSQADGAPDGQTVLLRSVDGSGRNCSKAFMFDRVFPTTATSKDIFGEVGSLVRAVGDGAHACVFAYGQTGSGKTFTMNQLSEAAMQELWKLQELRLARLRCAEVVGDEAGSSLLAPPLVQISMVRLTAICINGVLCLTPFFAAVPLRAAASRSRSTMRLHVICWVMTACLGPPPRTRKTCVLLRPGTRRQHSSTCSVWCRTGKPAEPHALQS